jgi:GntR family transcriptional regulator
MSRGSTPPAAEPAAASPLAIPSRRPTPGAGAELGRGQLSRNSYVPLYYQLAVILEERTESGEYAPGEEFPSEQELCREFGISRTVVRPAIAILEREGRVARSKGKRTIVEPPKTVHRVGGLLRVLVESGERDDVEVRLLEVGRETGAPETAALLGLAPGEPMLRIAAVADLAGAPTAIYWSFVAERDFAWLASLPVGSRLTGQEAQIRRLGLGRAEVLVESSWCTEFEASELDIPVGSPIFVARGTEGRVGGRRKAASALEVCWAIYRASSARLSVSLGEAGTAGREPAARRPERPARRARRSAD